MGFFFSGSFFTIKLGKIEILTSFWPTDYIYIYICRTPQLVGNFEALGFIEAEEKRKNKAEKGKRTEELEKRKTNLQHSLLAVR